MSKFSVTTISVYYSQNPLKMNVSDCIVQMVAELLQTLLGGMVIDKGKPKYPKKSRPSLAGMKEHKPLLHTVRN